MTFKYFRVTYMPRNGSAGWSFEVPAFNKDNAADVAAQVLDWNVIGCTVVIDYVCEK